MHQLERCSYGLAYPITRENSYRVLGELGAWRMFFDTLVNRKLSTTTQSTKGKVEHFWYLEQASNTRQVLEAKSSVVETPLVVQASRRLVSTYLGYQELVLCSLV